MEIVFFYAKKCTVKTRTESFLILKRTENLIMHTAEREGQRYYLHSKKTA
jgi:hypothetical protein